MVGYYSTIDGNTWDAMRAWFRHWNMVTLALPLLYLGLLVWIEHTYPARVIAKEKSWYMRAVCINTFIFIVYTKNIF